MLTRMASLGTYVHYLTELTWFLIAPCVVQRGHEAVAAYMEDCVTMHELTTPHARLRWARASEGDSVVVAPPRRAPPLHSLQS